MTKRVDFFIVGAMRSGTSSLRDGLRKDPRLSIPKGEPMFFSLEKNYAAGVEEYHSLFEWDESQLRGEKSPNYSVVNEAPERLQAYNPAAKMIWILRDPVKRAIAHHHHALFRNPDIEPLADALVNGTLAAMGPLAYVYRSEYYKQLQNWLRYFPIHQHHIMIFEEVVAQPIQKILEVYDFLELERPDVAGRLDDDFFPHSFNKALKKLSKENEQTDNTVSRVRELLSPSIYELELILGRKISAWQ